MTTRPVSRLPKARRTSPARAFTLVELLVVVAVLLILVNLLLVPLMTGMSLTGATEAQVEAQDRVNRALSELQRDMAQAMYVYPSLGGRAAAVLFTSYPEDLLATLTASHVDLVLPKKDSQGNIIQPLQPDGYITRYYVAPVWDDLSPDYENMYRRSATNPPDQSRLCVLYRVRFNPFDPQLDGAGNVTNALFEGVFWNDPSGSGDDQWVGMDIPWRGLGRQAEYVDTGPNTDPDGESIGVAIHWQLPWFYQDEDTSPVTVAGTARSYAYWWSRLSEPLTPPYRADLAFYAYKGLEEPGNPAARAGNIQIAMFGLDNTERGKYLPLGLFDGRDLGARPDTPSDPAYLPPVPGLRIEPTIVSGETLKPTADHARYSARYRLWQPLLWPGPGEPPLQAWPVHVFNAAGNDVTASRALSYDYPGGLDGIPAGASGTWTQPGVNYQSGLISFAVEALNMYVYDWDAGANVDWDGSGSQLLDPHGLYDDLVQLDYHTFQVRGWYHEVNTPPDDLPPPPPPFGALYPVFVALTKSDSIWLKEVWENDTDPTDIIEHITLCARVSAAPGKSQYNFDSRTGLITFSADSTLCPLNTSRTRTGYTLIREEIEVRYRWRDNFSPRTNWTSPDIVNDTVVASYRTWANAAVDLNLVAFGPSNTSPTEIRRNLRVTVNNAAK